MNLAAAISMYGGGPNSGPTAPCPQCGPKGEGKRGHVIVKHNLQMLGGDRKKWPAHIKHLVVPPAWTDLMYNKNPEGNLLVMGKDSKGRLQYIYNAKFLASKAAAKFSRVTELQDKLDSILKQNEKNRKSSDAKTKDAADVLAVIAHTGARPGGEGSGKAEKKAYGILTLQARHVKEGSGGNVKLLFVGKKGIKNDIPVEDESLKKMLLSRSKEAAKGGDTHAPLFPNVGKNGLLNYVKGLDGGGFSTKDFRTLLASKVAEEEIAAVKKAPSDLKSYKKAVKGVAKEVARRLGNTPGVALKSYIPPAVFSEWKKKAGVV